MIACTYRSALSRREALIALGATIALPHMAGAASVREITWDDLIPPGVPYGEIVGEGELDEINDTWRPIYDANASKLNEQLNGELIKLPGYIIPIDFAADGVRSFILVPYVGACIHVPPPPANQLVFVTTGKPWPSDQLWDAVWVTGRLQTQSQATDIADTGYSLAAQKMEPYIW